MDTHNYTHSSSNQQKSAAQVMSWYVSDKMHGIGCVGVAGVVVAMLMASCNLLCVCIYIDVCLSRSHSLPLSPPLSHLRLCIQRDGGDAILHQLVGQPFNHGSTQTRALPGRRHSNIPTQGVVRV